MPRRRANCPESFEPLDIAYLAGLFEGEGTVRVARHYYAGGEKRHRLTPQVKLRVQMTDREPLERVRDTIGGRIMGPYQYRGCTKPYWILDLDSPALVRRVAELIGPLLSPRRRDQLSGAGVSLS